MGITWWASTDKWIGEKQNGNEVQYMPYVHSVSRFYAFLKIFIYANKNTIWAITSVHPSVRMLVLDKHWSVSNRTWGCYPTTLASRRFRLYPKILPLAWLWMVLFLLLQGSRILPSLSYFFKLNLLVKSSLCSLLVLTDSFAEPKHRKIVYYEKQFYGSQKNYFHCFCIYPNKKA